METKANNFVKLLGLKVRGLLTGRRSRSQTSEAAESTEALHPLSLPPSLKLRGTSKLRRMTRYLFPRPEGRGLRRWVKLALALFFVLSLAFLLVVPVKADTLPCNQGQVLCVGATGPDVRKLQEALNSQIQAGGYELQVDCIFGNSTWDAVYQFQKENPPLTKDGMAGPETLGALGLPTSGLISTGASCAAVSGNAIATLCEQFNAKKQACIDLITGIGAPMTCTVAQGKLMEFANQSYTDAALVSKFVSDAMPLTGCVVGGDGTCTPACDASKGETCQSGTCVMSSGGGGCGGDVNLVNVNGLCMPKSDFGGIAAAGNWQDLAKKIIDTLLTVSGVIAVLFILYGGFLYITSAGNEEQTEKGRKALVNAIIGLVVVILSFVIVQVLANLLAS